MKHHTKQETVSLAFNEPERQNFKVNMLNVSYSGSLGHSTYYSKVTSFHAPVYRQSSKVQNLIVGSN